LAGKCGQKEAGRRDTQCLLLLIGEHIAPFQSQLIDREGHLELSHGAPLPQQLAQGKTRGAIVEETAAVPNIQHERLIEHVLDERAVFGRCLSNVEKVNECLLE
jgi:hypothetical protein